MWSRDAGHQYNIFKSNRNSCREFVCINLCPSKSSLCAMLRLLLTKCLIVGWKRLCQGDSSSLMWLSTAWCDFLYRRRAMGMMWLFPHDVTWARRSYYVLFAEVVPAYLTFSLHGGNVPLFIPLTYLFWMGGTFVFFIWWFGWFGMKKGVRWRREFRTSCCGQWWPWVLRLTTHESGVVRGVVRGSFGGSFGCIFSTCFHLCSLLVPFFIFFSFFLTDCYFFSFHCFLRSLSRTPSQSDHCGRMIVCNAKQCWQKSSLQCEGWALSCLL